MSITYQFLLIHSKILLVPRTLACSIQNRDRVTFLFHGPLSIVSPTYIKIIMQHIAVKATNSIYS